MLTRHALAAIVLGLVIPALSWLDGTGSMAWTMFSKSETYRLEVRVITAAGATEIVNPTELAPFVSRDMATFLSGAESWRHGPVGRSFEGELPGLARLACMRAPHPRHAHVRVERRRNLDAPVESASFDLDCSG